MKELIETVLYGDGGGTLIVIVTFITAALIADGVDGIRRRTNRTRHVGEPRIVRSRPHPAE